MKKFTFAILWSSSSLLGLTAAAQGGAFFNSGNDLVVARLGDGTTSYATEGAPVFLDEYNVSGAAPVLEDTVAFASSGASSLTESYNTGGRDGYLTLSPNGNYLAFAGYRKDAGLSDPAGDTSAATPRVVGIVGQNGLPDTSTALNYSSGTNFRSAITTDGNSIYLTDNLGGTGTIGYTTRGSSTVTALNVTNSAGFRSVAVANNQLYGVTGSTPKGIFALTDSVNNSTLPTGANAVTETALSADSSSQITLLDLSSTVPGPDTMYVAGSASFNKYSLVGGTWQSNGSIADGDYITGVAALQSGNSVNLFYSTNAGVYKYTDGGYNTPLSSSLGSAYITPALANETFRGIALAPTAVPEPATFGLLAVAGAGLLVRRRRD